MKGTNKHLEERVPVYAIIWLVSYAGSLLALKTFELEASVGIILSCIPVLAFAIFIYKFYRSIYFMDEVQIKIQMEASVIAFTLSLLLLMTLGLLDLASGLNKEDWSYRHLVPYMVIFYFIGLFITRRKYNFDNEKLD